MSRAKKTDSKTIASQKRRRRQWITFVRMCRYGVNNFSRNAWLTIAATAMMTLTLSVIMMTLMARNVLTDSLAGVRDKVDMSIYLKNDTPDKDIKNIEQNIRDTNGVLSVTYITPDQARENYAKENKDNPQALRALNVSEVKFPGNFRINVADINDTSSLSEFVNNNKLYLKHQDVNWSPSFAGESKDVIDEIGRWVTFAEKMGLAASVLLVTISSLIVFNTIRMAIFNRKEEIEMMKLIGADRGFIRGPFIVEAVVYGFIAAVLATGLSMLALYLAQPKLEGYGVIVGNTLDMVVLYIGLVLPVMILLGAIIGVISSLLATRKYLKI